MKIPHLNPLKFYKNEGQKDIHNLSFKDFVAYRNATKRNFKQSFLDKVENIYNEPFLAGVYGFTNTNVSIDNDASAIKQTNIYFNVIELGTHTALKPYPVILTLGQTELNKILVIKTNLQIGVQLLDGTTIQQTLNDVNPINGLVQIPLTSTYTNLIVKIKSDLAISTKVEIKGIVVAEEPKEYTFNDALRMSKLIDISKYGAVYSFNSQTETSFLPSSSAGDDYSDIIRKYEIDISSNYANQVGLKISLSNSLSFTFKNLPQNINDQISGCYDWISWYQIVSDPGGAVIRLIVEIAHYELLSVEHVSLLNGSSLQSFPVSYLSQRIDDEFWYQADGISEILTNPENACATIEGVLRAKKETDFNSYRSYGLSVDTYKNTSNVYTANIESFPQELELGQGGLRRISYGTNNDELLKINKIAHAKPYTSCGVIKINGYTSEPFEIITQEKAYNKRLINLEYSHFKDYQNLSFDNFTGAMLLPFVLESHDSQEVTVFNGQYENSPRGSESLKLEDFVAYKPIPIYLKSMLESIFNFDNLKLDSKEYGIKDKAETNQIDVSLMYDFSIILRLGNYNYI